MPIERRGTSTAGYRGTWGTDFSVTMPATVEANDQLLVAIIAEGRYTWTIPSGWVEVAAASYDANRELTFFRKTAAGNEDGTTQTFTASASTAGLWTAICYGGVDSTTPLDVATVVLEMNTNTTTPTLPSQTSTVDGAMFVGFFANRASSAFSATNTPGSGSTEVTDVQNGDVGLNIFFGLYAEEQLKPTAGALAQTATMGTSTAWQGVQVVLRPAPPAGQYARPTATVAAGSWTRGGTDSGTLQGQIDETVADDADWIQSSLDPATDLTKIRLSGVQDPLVGTGHVVRYRYRKNATGGSQINLVVRLYRADGTTVVASQTHTNIDAITNGSFTLSTAEADSIPSADYATGLVIGFEATTV